MESLALFGDDMLQEIDAQNGTAVEQFVPESVPLDVKVKLAIETILEGILEFAWEPCASVSGGKDSMTTLSLTMVAMALAMKKWPAALKRPVLHIVSSDTKMESLPKEHYMRVQFDKAVEYGKRHGFKVEVHRPAPDRTGSYIRIFSGGRPDPTPGINSKNKQCANDYKIKPIHTEMREINNRMNFINKKLIMMVGSRSEESTRRADSLEQLGASKQEPILKMGYWTLYPVMDWSLDDIWQYLCFAEDDLGAKIPGYQDGFDDVIKLYSSLNSGECVAGVEQGNSACGARDGCHQCGIVTEDKSGINQANSKELYHIKRTLDALLALRDFRIGLGKNFQNRNFVTMKNDSGYLSLKPNGYAGWLLEENLRIALTIQEMELQRASDQERAILRIKKKIANGTIHNRKRAKRWIRRVEAHAEPLLNWITPADLIWIDFQWSLRGLTRQAHSALRIWDEVVNKGKWAKIPDADYKRPEHVSKDLYQEIKKMPNKAKIKHGISLCEYGMTEFTDMMMTLHDDRCSAEGSYSDTYQLNQKGDTVEADQFNISDKYSVDDDSAAFICYQPSMIISTRCDGEPYEFRHQNSVNRYLRFGVIHANKNQLRNIHEKLEFLYFTAASGLQELAYIGGQAKPGQVNGVEFDKKKGQSCGELDLETIDINVEYCEQEQAIASTPVQSRVDMTSVIQMF